MQIVRMYFLLDVFMDLLLNNQKKRIVFPFFYVGIQVS